MFLSRILFIGHIILNSLIYNSYSHEENRNIYY